jgi:hypothetical protein
MTTRLSFTLALSAVLLLGAGCSASTNLETSNPDAASTNDAAPAASTNQTPVGYADTNANLLDGKEDYKMYTFTQNSGDCSTKGLPTTLQYREDTILKFFILDSADGSYRDEMVLATPTTVSFDQILISGVNAKCAISAGFGTNDGTLGCSAFTSDEFNPQPLCSGTVTITATPR